jgi:hypothetical protein
MSELILANDLLSKQLPDGSCFACRKHGRLTIMSHERAELSSGGEILSCLSCLNLMVSVVGLIRSVPAEDLKGGSSRQYEENDYFMW